jgi:DNA (cytosine-5)-methyltransferase 1
MVLLENVRGISAEFPRTHGRRGYEPFVERIRRALERRGYRTFPALLRSVDLGVPQLRPRFFLVGVQRRSYAGRGRIPNPFSDVDRLKANFLERLGLRVGSPLSVADAISDLQVRGNALIECKDSPGFSQIRYAGPRTHYQKQMHGAMNGHAPNSLRLANHRPEIRARYVRMVKSARKGVHLPRNESKKFGVRKMTVVVLDKHAPSHTLTTLPDDYVHYSEPRILTVRECARLQSFPDWFEFKGVYTTGGLRRRHTCPRYTQVGNAVPPRVATFLGELVMRYSAKLSTRTR